MTPSSSAMDFLFYFQSLIHVIFSLAPGEECECSAFVSVCLSVRMHNSKTVAPIDLIFLHKKEFTGGSNLFSNHPDPDLDSIIY